MGNSPSTLSPSPPSSKPQSSDSACPVDPSARQVYLDAAASSTPDPPPPPKPKPKPKQIPFFYGIPSYFLPDDPSQFQPPPLPTYLGNTRTTSTIPRSITYPSRASAHSPNAQTTSPTTSASGNWVYPSEAQFYSALQRKQHSPKAKDMRALVPIHNAVNERVWHQIKHEWEHKYAKEENADCGGPRLLEFEGKGAGRLSPRAKWLGLWGYEEPFDRHDWIIERCPLVGVGDNWGEVRQVHYVIDFYRGRGAAAEGGGVSFHLDVRPKLNSLEGWRMRLMKVFGM